MNQRSIAVGLVGVLIILIIGLVIAVLDQKVRLDEKYSVGEKTCDAKGCVTPLSISGDRLSAHLLVFDANTNYSCLQDINNGVLYPILYSDCHYGSDWNGWQDPNEPKLVFP